MGLHIHQLKETELSFFVIEEQINIGISSGVISCCRAKQVQMFNAELFQIGFVVPQSCYDFFSLHTGLIISSRFNIS